MGFNFWSRRKLHYKTIKKTIGMSTGPTSQQKTALRNNIDARAQTFRMDLARDSGVSPNTAMQALAAPMPQPSSNVHGNETDEQRRLRRYATVIVIAYHARHCRDPACPHSWCPLFRRLFQHATNCNRGSDCPLRNCRLLKAATRHFQTCTNKSTCSCCSRVMERIGSVIANDNPQQKMKQLEEELHMARSNIATQSMELERLQKVVTNFKVAAVSAVSAVSDLDSSEQSEAAPKRRKRCAAESVSPKHCCPCKSACKRTRNEAAAPEVLDASADTCVAALKQQLTCVVCMDRPRGVVFAPCWHVAVCQGCADKCGNVCPVCRTKVKSSNVVFLP